MSLPPKYVLFGSLLFLHMVLGAIANHVSPGAFVGGIRTYFNFLPLFFLPVVYAFTEADIRRFLRFVLVLAVFQVPVSLYHRIFVFPSEPTGDVVRGTFPNGAIMSIFLVGTVVVLVAMNLRGQIRRPSLLICSVLLLLPTLINETKGTVVLLPLALFALAYFSQKFGAQQRAMLKLVAASAVFVLAFSVAYDKFIVQDPDSGGILEYFTERAVEGFYKGPDAEPRPGFIARGDSIAYAFQKLIDDPVKLAFGLGIGNVPNPSTVSIIRGEFSLYYETYGASVTTYAFLLWETGVTGILLTLVMVAIAFGDARFAARSNDYFGALALAWTSILAVMPIALMYKNLVHTNVIAILCMFIAGVFAAKRARDRTVAFDNQTN